MNPGDEGTKTPAGVTNSACEPLSRAILCYAGKFSLRNYLLPSSIRFKHSEAEHRRNFVSFSRLETDADSLFAFYYVRGDWVFDVEEPAHLLGTAALDRLLA